MAAEFSRHPFLLSAQDVAAELQTDIDKGLTKTQVQEQQGQHPEHELDVGGAIPWYKILTKRLFSATIIVRRPTPPPWPRVYPPLTSCQVLVSAIAVSLALPAVTAVITPFRITHGVQITRVIPDHPRHSRLLAAFQITHTSAGYPYRLAGQSRHEPLSTASLGSPPLLMARPPDRH